MTEKRISFQCLIRVTHLWVAGKTTRGWQAIKDTRVCG